MLFAGRCFRTRTTGGWAPTNHGVKAAIYANQLLRCVYSCGPLTKSMYASWGTCMRLIQF
jgi:hypothetical protein